MPNVAFSKPVEDSVPKVNKEIAVGEDLEFQRRWWRFEKGIWIFFALLIVLALAGAFGRGPLAKANTQSPDGAMHIAYDRIQRTGTPSVLRVELGQAAFQNGEIHLFVSESIARQLGASRIIPQPASTVIGQGGFTYTFPASVPPGAVEFALEPSGPGVFPFKVSIPGGSDVQAKIIVLP